MSQTEHQRETTEESVGAKRPYEEPRLETLADARAVVVLATAATCSQAQDKGPPAGNCNFLS